jgi:hypothetical protein
VETAEAVVVEIDLRSVVRGSLDTNLPQTLEEKEEGSAAPCRFGELGLG